MSGSLSFDVSIVGVRKKVRTGHGLAAPVSTGFARYDPGRSRRAGIEHLNGESLVPALGVESQYVVHTRDPAHGRLVVEGGVWTAPVVAVNEGAQRGLTFS
jgi:hypothetical protein